MLQFNPELWSHRKNLKMSPRQFFNLFYTIIPKSYGDCKNK